VGAIALLAKTPQFQQRGDFVIDKPGLGRIFETVHPKAYAH